ncbi:hypothetical protein CERSUDRAFT_81947 [Gelatoporia subvermispora B]|uniref:GATA-type domain-containing protein n=1 Tax=Ceriporiopsis subvermispora (strain B) TaxID=914234 RepID=M2RL34_CERS8|nr:hypothetical protein CERSUDRAFT_81947 [Gelatoporia subvermispora B]
MASDGRYVYHSPQDVAPTYGYAPYAPPAPYEHAQFAQGGSRQPVRPNQPPPRSQDPQQSLNTPPANYIPTSPQPPPPQYAPPAYGVPPGAPWPADAQWAQYPPSFAPPHPGQEPTQAAPVSRTEQQQQQPASDSRAYPSPAVRPDQRRPDERPPQPPDPSKARKNKENESPTAAQPQQQQPQQQPPPPPPPVQSAVSLGLDFVKLSESYRFVLDSTNAFLHDPELARLPVPQESVERMAQAATYGVHAVDAANKRAMELSRPPADRPPEGDEDPAKARQAQGENPPPAEGQTCLGCNATSTPEWRRGPMGPRTLCNACGLVYAKLIKKRNRDLTRSRGAPQAKAGAPGAHVDESVQPSSGEGGSDDDSFNSQDGRSDAGFPARRD